METTKQYLVMWRKTDHNYPEYLRIHTVTASNENEAIAKVIPAPDVLSDDNATYREYAIREIIPGAEMALTEDDLEEFNKYLEP